MFLHDTNGLSHLFCNMFGVWMFGRTLEQVWGAKKFLFFYFFTGIGAGIIQELTWMIDLHDITTAMNIAIAENSGEALVPFSSMFSGGNIAYATATDVIRLKQQIFAAHVTVGASGALFGILLAFGWLFPEARMGLLFVPFMIPARIFVAIYAAFELFFGVAGFAFDNVAHFAHLGGMFFGWLLLVWWKWRKGWMPCVRPSACSRRSCARSWACPASPTGAALPTPPGPPSVWLPVHTSTGSSSPSACAATPSAPTTPSPCPSSSPTVSAKRKRS